MKILSINMNTQLNSKFSVCQPLKQNQHMDCDPLA